MNNQPSILVVGDEPTTLSVTRQVLETAGYQVVLASSAAEALEMAHHHKPDLIIVDDVLPDSSGLELGQAIKKDAQFCGVFVVLLSAPKTATEDQIESLEAGCDDCITRPISKRKLAVRVRALLRIQAAENSLRQERDRTQKILQEQRALLNGILESTDEIVFSVDLQYHYTSFNRRHAQIMKAIYGAQIHLGDNIMQHISVEEDRLKVKIDLDRALAGEAVIVESYFGEENISRMYFDGRLSPIRNTQGEITGAAVFVQDHTWHRHVEEALRQSEQRFRCIYEQLPIGIGIYDQDGLLMDANAANLEIFGIDDVVEVKGLNLFAELNLPQPEALKLMQGEILRFESQFDLGLVRRCCMNDKK